MSQAPLHPQDPLGPSLAITALFAALCAVRLTTLADPYFDEVHYLPAAREMLAGGAYINREHPLLGKTILAAGIALLGDNPLGWRIFPLLAGATALFASMRAMWHASLSRFATIAFGILLASGFMLLVQARIAMLDIFMVAFLALAAWQFAAAMRKPEQGQWRLAATGLFLGAAMAAKWNAVLLAMVPGIAFFLARLAAGRRRLFTSRRGIPVPGVSLVEAFVWLGLLPLAIYALSFWPALYLADNPIRQGGLLAMHAEMLALHAQVLAPHAYQSTWPDWVTNTRAIWYFYEAPDGIQRGVLMLGNPLTMLAGIPAIFWCVASGFSQRNWARLGVAIGYLVSLGLWFFAGKSVQFFHHYLVPQMFLLGALALALDALWQAGYRKLVWLVLGGSCALFAWFYPILTAAPLAGPMSFLDYAWIPGWR
ncbi:MAG: phospholipid carrier-dependent glycosyltransferase [Erythrobacter sp.]